MFCTLLGIKYLTNLQEGVVFRSCIKPRPEITDYDCYDKVIATYDLLGSTVSEKFFFKTSPEFPL